MGSNLGERKPNLAQAVSLLHHSLHDITVSSVYETRPLYYTEQPLFLNIVLQGTTVLSPHRLLNRALGIEQKLGRQRIVANGPRLIDIDLLLYNNKRIEDETLRIPHPLMTERRFVLIPLLEISPALHDPISKLPYSSFLKRLQEQGVYTFSVWDYTQSPTV